MQKLLKKFYLLTVLILTVCLAASCTMLSDFKKLSETGHASINGKKVNLKTMGDPEKDCLAFGYLKIPTEQLYIQSDPSKEPIYTTPFVFQGAYSDGSIFCFPPFKTDLAFQLASLRNVNFNVITTFSPQLGAEGKIAFVTHNGVINVICSHITGKIWTNRVRNFKADYASLTIINITEDSKEVELTNFKAR